MGRTVAGLTCAMVLIGWGTSFGGGEVEPTRRKSVRTERMALRTLPDEAWLADDEHQVTSRAPAGPTSPSPAAIEGEMSMLSKLLGAGAVARDAHDREMADLKAKYKVALEAAGDGPRPLTSAYHKGRMDAFEALLGSGAISREVYEREAAKAKAEYDPGAHIADYRGRMGILGRLYDRGEITTATFHAFHTPVWDAWYRALNILRNGDFEVVEDRIAPDRLVDLKDWAEYTMPKDLGFSRLALDRAVKHSGRQSLRFTSSRGPSQIVMISNWFFCERDDDVKIRFWAKARDFKRAQSARSAIVSFVKSGGARRYQAAIRLHVPEGTYDWTRLEGRLRIFGNVPEGKVEPCRLAITFHGEGTLWLDDMVVVPTTRRDPK